MPRSSIQFALIASLLCLGFVTRAEARVDSVVAPVPPSPGELILSFGNDIPTTFDRLTLRFSGTADSNGYSAPTTLTWKFNWKLESGEIRYSVPTTIGLEPGRTADVAGLWVAGGCPSEASVDFTTNSPFGATVNGTFDHTCTIPEPSICTLLALGSAFLLSRRRLRKMPIFTEQPTRLRRKHHLGTTLNRGRIAMRAQSSLLCSQRPFRALPEPPTPQEHTDMPYAD